MISITPCGAAGGEVTGSSYHVQTSSERILVDCGMFQGGKKADLLNKVPCGRAARDLNAVLLTHAHLDHVGRLPLLVANGFKGPVYATPATIELTGLILRDAAKIQKSDSDRENRKLERAGKASKPPLFTMEDVETILHQMRPVPYHQPVRVTDGIEAIWVEAGHLLGSGSIRLLVKEGDGFKKIVFSGDLGPAHAPMLRPSEPFEDASLVFLESTYGDRDHRPFEETVAQFTELVRDVVKNNGTLLVPTFAVGRAQLMPLLLARMFRDGTVPRFPVFLDSPMAIEAGKIMASHPELFDDELNLFLRQGNLQEDLKTMKVCLTPDESRAINDVTGPCLIMAGAGMCNAGRILHHLKHRLWKPETHVVVIGYQAGDSIGRRLVEGAKQIRIFGETIQVRATIHTLGGFSAHAGQLDLLHWFEAVAPSRPMVALTHGEDHARKVLASKIESIHGIVPVLPELGEAISL